MEILLSIVAGFVILYLLYKPNFKKIEIIPIKKDLPKNSGIDFSQFIKFYSKDEIDNLIKKYAEKYDIEVKLLRAIIKVESDFIIDAENKEGSFGLCQIHKNLLIGYYPEFQYKTLTEIRAFLFNPENNLDIACKFLSHLIKKYKGNLSSIIQAYNLGETKFDKGIKSTDYLNKVMKFYKMNI